MLEIFAPVRELFHVEPVCIDNLIFRLHSRVTVILLTVCAIAVSAKQFIGEPISCMTDDSLSIKPVNAYCWIYSTFTVKRHLRGVPGREIISPGVGPVTAEDEILHQRYYQWVCFVLLLQATIFYGPRALWGVWEGGLIGFLSKDLSSPFLRDAWTPERKRQLLGYFADGVVGHNFYALRFLFCEFLNFFNAVAQICFLDLFLERQFSEYGLSVTAFALESQPFERDDPMARLFPKVTKCTIYTYGPSGSSQTHDALCVLPLNVVNEKIFIFIWFWLVFLAVVSGIIFIYRIVTFCLPWLRVILLRATVRNLPLNSAETVVRKIGFGDWFVLIQLAKNTSPLVIRDLAIELANRPSKHFV